MDIKYFTNYVIRDVRLRYLIRILESWLMREKTQLQTTKHPPNTLTLTCVSHYKKLVSHTLNTHTRTSRTLQTRTHLHSLTYTCKDSRTTFSL